MIKHKFKTPLFLVEFEVIIYENENEVPINSIANKYKNRIGFVNRAENEDITIFLNQFHKLSVGEIAHEAKHLVNEIIIDFGGKIDLDNDETECYLLQWVMDELYKLIK